MNEIIIDVGGEKGQFLWGLAQHNPQKEYVVLEPRIVEPPNGVTPPKIPRVFPGVLSENMPKNLHFIAWKTDEESKLPFQVNSIDEAHIHMLYSVLDTKQNDKYMNEESGRNIWNIDYLRLLHDIKRILKPSGKIHITDVTPIVGDLIQNAGFNNILENKYDRKNSPTPWGRMFGVSEWTANK